MGIVRHLILLFFFAVLAIAEAQSSSLGSGASPATSTMCLNGKVGDCIDASEEMSMDSESNRRALAQTRRYISYDALKKDSIPCGQRGNSYYNCAEHIQANPYTRGCTMITKCARNTR